MCKFLHVRNRDANGNLLNNGGATVAFDVDGDVLFYASALCSRKDQFNRRIGRLIAEGRFDKGIAGVGPIATKVLPPLPVGAKRDWKPIINHLAEVHKNAI